MPRKKIGEILLEAGVLSEGRLNSALREQKKWGQPLGITLIEIGAISEEALVLALSEQLKFPTVDLDMVKVPADVVALVSGEDAQRLGIMPLKQDGKFLDIAMTNPTDVDIIDGLRIKTKLNIRPYIAGPKSIERCLDRFYQGRANRPRRTPASIAPAAHVPTSVDLDLSPSKPAAPAPRFTSPQGTANVSSHTDPALQSVEIDLSDAASKNMPIVDPTLLSRRIDRLEALLIRNDGVIRKLMELLIEKRLVTKEELVKKIS